MTERLSRERLQELRKRSAVWDGETLVHPYFVPMTIKEMSALLDAAERDLDALAVPSAEPEQPHWPTVAATLREVADRAGPLGPDSLAFSSALARRARKIEEGEK